MHSTDSVWTVVPRILGAALLALLVSVGGMGCDGGGPGTDPNAGPTVENEIQDQNANAGGEAIQVDLGPVFSASSDASLSYTVSSSDEAVATAGVDGATLTVTPQEGGEAEITVTAGNEEGEATVTFTVAVFADPPGRPDYTSDSSSRP